MHKSFRTAMAFTLAVAWFIPAAAAELPNFADLVERSAPAIVEISTSRANQQGNLFDEFDDLFRRQIPDGRQPEEPFQPRTVGSGFIVSDDGYVITNNHVVYGADEIRVHLNDRRVLVADVVGLDEPSDLALLKLEAADLPFVGFGDSDALRIGDWVLAIGSPFEFLAPDLRAIRPGP